MTARLFIPVFAVALAAGSANAADYSDYAPRTSERYDSRFAVPAERGDRNPRVSDDFDEDDDGRARHVRRPGDFDGDRRWGDPYALPRIEARASQVGGYLPRYEKEARARRNAIDAWRDKAEDRYGRRFAHWRAAADKWIDCQPIRGGVACTASARPVRGWGWGWRERFARGD
ncbi:MAG: hypothetical protein ACT4OU_06665 [Hyphomicrobium sp.]